MSKAPDTGGLQADSKSKIQNLLPFHNLRSIQCPKCHNVATHFQKSIIGLPCWCLKLSCGSCSRFWYVCTMCHGKFYRNLQLSPEEISSHASVHVRQLKQKKTYFGNRFGPNPDSSKRQKCVTQDECDLSVQNFQHNFDEENHDCNKSGPSIEH